MERILLDRVRRAAAEKECVCLLSPMPSAEPESDGYLRRIRAIDETVLEPYVRIYLMGDRPDLRGVLAEKRDEKHFLIQFDSGSFFQRRQVFSLIRRCGRLYIHSAYRFVAGPVSPKLLDVLDVRGVKTVWDVHGAVPEEIELSGDLLIARRGAAAEEALFHKSSVIVCVTRAMEDHLRSKYGRTAAETVLLPIFDQQTATASADPYPASAAEKPVVVYAGGLQKWQCVDAMIDLIDKTWDRYDYRIYTPNPEALLKSWGPGEGKRHITVASVPPAEMDAAYRGCRYGLLLREDMVVNNVAFPTKLLEYVSHGIVPVLWTSRIGDAEAQGFSWVKKEDLLAGRVPDDQTFEKQRAANFTALAKHADVSRKGIETLRNCLAAD